MNGLLHKLPGTVVQKNNGLVERNVIPDRSKWTQTEYILKGIVQTNKMQGLHSDPIESFLVPVVVDIYKFLLRLHLIGVSKLKYGLNTLLRDVVNEVGSNWHKAIV